MTTFFLAILVPVVIIIIWRVPKGFSELLKIAGSWRRNQLRDVYRIKWFFSAVSFILFIVFIGLGIYNIFPAIEYEPDDTIGSEIVFLLDISRSMNAPDVEPTRMEKAAGIIRSIAERTRGAAKSLVVFKGTALNVVPVTEDNEAIYAYLNVISSDTLSATGTNIEKGIAAALDAFSTSQSYNKFLFVFTDGESLEGNPSSLSGRLDTMNVDIVFIGLGTVSGSTIPGSEGTVMDSTGEPVISRLNETRLLQLSAVFDGSYVNSQSVASLAEIGSNVYNEREGFRQIESSRYRIFALIALIALLINWGSRVYRWKDLF